MRDLIVDGYNVLHADPGYARILGLDFATARDRLIDDLASFAAGEWRATVVFDGGAREGEETEADVGGVRVVYTSAGITADEVIERTAREVREAGGAATVVTSDASTQWTVLGAGVTRMSARELLSEMASDTVERTEHRSTGQRRGTLEQRLDETTRSGLLRFLGGQEREGPG